MAVTDLVTLKKRAIKAGMAKADARKADRETLEDFLSNGKPHKKVAKKAVKKAVAKKRTGRKQAPAKSRTTGKAKRSASAPAKRGPGRPRKTAPSNGDAGRLMIGKISYTNYDEADWKPRKGSAVDLIFRSLKRHKDNAEAVFDELASDIATFVGASKKDGTRRSKADREAMLKYRINRTRFEFAVRTGQHQSATNRIEYGTGPNAGVRKKRAKAEPKAAPKRRGRPPKSEQPKRKPGRPKGSTTRKRKKVAR